MQPLPDAKLLPIPQPPPAGRAAAATQFLGEQSPWAPGPQDEDDAAKGGAIGDTRASPFRLGRLVRQQGFDGFPQIVGNKRGGVHDPLSCHLASVLKHGLILQRHIE
jgi:hypothetical protein